MAKSPKRPSKTKSAESKKPAMRGKTTTAKSIKGIAVDAGDMYVVFGNVTNADTTPAAGVTVIAYDKDESREDRLGQATTDTTGGYKISYSEAAFRRSKKERGGADVIVRVYNDQNELLFTSKKKNNAPAEYELNMQVPIQQYVVRGTVKDANGKPLPNMIVRALERDLRIPQLLGIDETGANGDYRISYRPDAFQLGDLPSRRTPWLIVEVCKTAEGEVLAKQEIQRADRNQIVSFLLSNIGAISEWQRIGETVAPLLKGQGAPAEGTGTHETPADLPPEAITAHDLDFIVIETGLDRTAVQAWAVSSQMVRDAVLHLTDEYVAEQSILRKYGWPFFYGLVRQRGARDLDALLREPAQNVIQTLNVAASTHQIPPLNEKQVDGFIGALRLIQRLQQLDPVRSSNSDFAKLLGSLAMPLPKVVALDALAVVQEKGLNNTNALLKLAERHPDAIAPIKTFVRSVRVHQLTSGHEGLSRALNARLEGASDSIAPLARLHAIDWIDMAGEAGVSPGLALQTQAQVEKQHLLTALESKIHAGLFDLPGMSGSDAAALIKNQPAMVEKLLLGKVPVKTEESMANTVLRNTGRFLRTGVSMELAADLIKIGINSPGAALRYGREHLREQYRDRFPKDAVTEVIDGFFRYADGLVEGGKGIVLEVDINRRYPRWMMEEYKVPLPEPVRENAPTLAALFGDLDECLCRPCESMLGQPAYLVDLLNLLAKSTGKTGNALDVLRGRRPDIFKLDLSCENAEQTIQHIDIVLEILEKAAALEAAPGATAESIQQIAYSKLRRSIYPWQLPFDRGYAETSAYLTKLGVSREKLLRLRRDTTPAHLAAEALYASMDQAGDLNADSQWELLTRQRLGARLWAAYGFNIDNDIAIVDPASGELLTNQTVEGVLTRASFLIDRTRLSLEELEQTLQTEFVSGDSNGIALSGREQCKTSAMRLSAEGPVLEGILDRLHRFTRLKAKLPEWSIEHLGQAIVVCGGIESGATTDQLRAGLLVKLTIIKRLYDHHGLSLDALLEQPISEAYLRKALGLSLLQFSLLKELIGYSPTAQSVDWHALEGFCNAAKCLREMGLSVEQASQALLTRDRWEAVAGELPSSIKSDEQIETLLKAVQQRLRSVVAVRPEIALEAQAVEALNDIFDRDIASQIIRAIRNASGPSGRAPDATALAELVSTLSGATGHRLGEWLPLMDAQQSAALFRVTTTNNHGVDERFIGLLTTIAYRRRERELIAVLAEECGLSESEVVPLLASRLLLDPAQGQPLHAYLAFLSQSFWVDTSSTQPSPPSVTATAMPRLHAWMDRLYRLLALRGALGIDNETIEIAERITVGSEPGINWRDLLASASLNSTAWQNPQWQALLDLLWLQQPDQLSRPALTEVLLRLTAPGALVSADTLRPLTARVDIVETLAVPLIGQALSVQPGAISILDLRNPEKLRLAFEWLLLAKHIGADATQIARLIDPANNALAGDTAKALLEAKLAGDDLQTSLQKIGDLLRRQRRDALVAYHVAQIVGRNNSDKWNNGKALYEHFLIDHQMEPCFETTRILEAVTAVQLFAQRILFGIESEITAEPELKQRWTWMRNYRVWEANRKVFLFPENWLFPELRDDKSSSFKQLESALGQGELTQDLANQAFGQFLDDVAQMGQVQVLGMYEDISRDSQGNVQSDEYGVPLRRTLYVVGRTANPPYAYFWRHCVDFSSPHMEWSPWQRIELDIQGDHVMPFVLSGNLYIAWPLIRPIKNDSIDEWEVKLAWSRYDGKAWRKSSVSREFWREVSAPFSEEREGFSIRCETTPESSIARIIVYALAAGANTSNVKEPTLPGVPEPLFWGGDFNAVLNYQWALPLTQLIAGSFSNLPSAIKDQMTVCWMITESWTTSTDRNAPKVQSGGDPLYMNMRLGAWEFSGHPMYVFYDPDEAVRRHKQALRDNTHLERAVPDDAKLIDYIATFVDAYVNYSRSIQNNDSFNLFIEQLRVASSRRIVSCKAWMRIIGPSGAEDLVVLNGTEGIYSCLIEGQNVVPHGGTPTTITKVGEQSSAAYTLNLVVNGISLSSGPETLSTVPMGSLARATLNCEIDGRRLTQAQLKNIGIDLVSQRELQHVSEFHLSHDDLVTKTSGSGVILVGQVRNSQPWMNGFREMPAGPLSFTIARRGYLDTVIFNQTGSSQFWAIGSASSYPHDGVPLSWHYLENGYGCYVDLGNPLMKLSGNGFFVYPDSFSEATLRRADWSQFKILPSSQISNFGADRLPVPAMGSVAIWTQIRSGAFTFDARMPFACYNWEIYFHAPLLIADQLSKQHKFEEAERWLRFVFDPTSSEAGADAKRFLKFRVFKELDLNQQVIDDLTALAQVAGGFASDADAGVVRKLINRWRDAPFRPFLIARRRHIAFLWRTLFAYLDNLIAWADSLYRRDTRESINEATMLYVLAERILGRRPQLHQSKTNRPAFSYDDKITKWDEFANFWIDVGVQGQSNLTTGWRPKDTVNQPTPDGMLYFCMPFNDKVLSYWNTVDARLSNIRNCRNIEGVRRTLPLMDAPIDPELLVRATAAGLDLGDVIAGLYAPPPHYRYSILSGRAAELANECKSLGAAMLSAIEKRDAEHLAQLRSSNEISLLKLVRDVRALQISEAERNVEALRASRKTISARYAQYQRLLGKKDIPTLKENESAGEEAMLGTIDSGLASNRSNWGLIKEESEQYVGMEGANAWSMAANISKIVGGGFYVTASALAAVPADKFTNAAKVVEYVGTASSHLGDAFAMVSQGWRAHAEQQGMMAGHIRRRDEWAFQSNQTLKELQQIDKQILANQIRIDITKNELDNHLEQIEQAKGVDEVMRSKFSNVQLYEWMKTELSRLYFNAYRMAVDMARRAERAASRELGVKPLNIVRNDYWDSLRDGLLAGERLHQDLKRLEIAYLDQNRREYELTKHISLRRLNPEALVQLRAKAAGCTCEFDIPEWLFDLDTPGHYLRRIKSVSVSIPSVTGPFTSVNCKLTLLKSEVRHDSTGLTSPGYLRLRDRDDSRFADYFGATEAIVTSTGSADSGMFETQLRDERFLPFEGNGVISTWRLELPAEYPQFDYSTISDVILTFRYTARDGGDLLRDAATGSIASLMTLLQQPNNEPLRFPVLLSCRSDFPTQWARANATTDLTIPITRDVLPYWMEAVRIVAGGNVKKLTVREVSVADVLKETISAPSFSKVWPPGSQASTEPRQWSANALTDGVGTGNTGLLPNTLADRLLLLSVSLPA